MNCQASCSQDTINYLNRFHRIFETMMQAMNDAPLTNSISHNFIVQMMPHHQAAIEMSENLLKYSSMASLREIAENIIIEQTKSIADMRAIFPECSYQTNTEKELALYQRNDKRITEIMFSEMKNAPADNYISADFIREMIPHHRGAIRMAQNTLNFKICFDLKPILYAIISSQQKGIYEMENLLRCM